VTRTHDRRSAAVFVQREGAELIVIERFAPP